MSITVKRTNPDTGDNFLVVQDGSGNDIQPSAIVDANANWVTPALDSTVNTQATFIVGANSTIAQTAVQMTTVSTAAIKGVLIKASRSNAGTVFVGFDDGVTSGTLDATDGFELAAGDAVDIEINNTNAVWLISDTGTNRISFVGV